MLTTSPEFGLGDTHAQLKVYIDKRPNLDSYDNLSGVRELLTGDIADIGQHCGNGWRKVFNVYAKLVFALNQPALVPLNAATTWQVFRDKSLLQSGAKTSLIFSAPNFSQSACEQSASQQSTTEQSRSVHIVMGKTYAQTLPLAPSLTWLDDEFAIDKSTNLLVCPYFDYRQLSNIKIIRLVALINSLLSSH
jgi:hypothetical protein